jgi:hypothetical protein
MKESAMLRIAAAAAIGLVVANFSNAQERKFQCLDLKSKTNLKLSDNFGREFEGNHLKELPQGEQFLADIKFTIGEGVIQLGSKALEKFPEKVEGIAVGQTFTRLHLFHATVFGGGPNAEGTPWHVADGTPIGSYQVHYDDGSTETIEIVYGDDVRDWFYLEGEKEPSRGKPAWFGNNEFAPKVGAKLRLYVGSWKNPKPDRKVTRIDFRSRKEETVAAPFCIAMTIEQ